MTLKFFLNILDHLNPVFLFSTIRAVLYAKEHAFLMSCAKTFHIHGLIAKTTELAEMIELVKIQCSKKKYFFSSLL